MNRKFRPERPAAGRRETARRRTLLRAGMRAAPGLAALALAAGCSTQDPLPPGYFPDPAGYADGTKTVFTPHLVFSATGKGVRTDASGQMQLADIPATIRTLDVSGVIHVKAYGLFESWYWDSASNGWLGFSGDLYEISTTADGQARLLGYTMGGDDSYIVMGLPSRAPVLAGRTGSARYSGPARLAVDYAGGTGTYGLGGGTATLDVSFSPGAPTLRGTIRLDPLASDSPAHAIAPGTIVTIDPAQISGNGFASTLTLNAGQLGLSSTANATVSGQFYGPAAGTIGATFSATGQAPDGTGAFVHGGLLAN